MESGLVLTARFFRARGAVPLPEPERSHSNVAHLFEAHAKTDAIKGIVSYYIPGVGTSFKQIGERKETPEGKAFA
jgi:hypothetical protein